MLDAVGFDPLIADADLIFTGEGRIDSQTVCGKAVAGVASRAKRLGIPVIAFAGNIGNGAELTYDTGVTAIVSINRASLPLESAALRCREDLARTVDDVMNIMKIESKQK
jgi:glycerate kinase